MKSKSKKILKIAAGIFAFILIFAALQRLLEPKYTNSVFEGRLIAEYYKDAKNHELMFFGDCEVYENFSPVTFFEEYGINCYIRGGANQTIWQSYYLLEEALKYETPKVVAFNVLSMKYSEPVKEEYNRLNIDGMRLSSSKISSVNASYMKGESLLSYLFPILRYHDRITELNSDDFKYFFGTPTLSYNGYLLQTGVKPATYFPNPDTYQKLPSYEFAQICYDYLDKMTELCKNKGIEFVLIKAPSVMPYWYPQWEEQIVKYAAEKELKYYNFYKPAEEIGIDWDTDTYDGGLHLNVYGAEKLSLYFGRILINDLKGKGIKFTDFRTNSKIIDKWQSKIERYNTAKK